jgi:hypothetical protein
MPKLKNPRHEQFARAVAKGGYKIRAYRDAGYSADRGAASRLSRTVKVHARICELQERSADRVVATIARRIQKAHAAYEAATAANQFDAARAALREIAILAGFLIETPEYKRRYDPKRPSDPDLTREAIRPADHDTVH